MICNVGTTHDRRQMINVLGFEGQTLRSERRRADATMSEVDGIKSLLAGYFSYSLLDD